MKLTAFGLTLVLLGLARSAHAQTGAALLWSTDKIIIANYCVVGPIVNIDHDSHLEQLLATRLGGQVVAAIIDLATGEAKLSIPFPSDMYEAGGVYYLDVDGDHKPEIVTQYRTYSQTTITSIYKITAFDPVALEGARR